MDKRIKTLLIFLTVVLFIMMSPVLFIWGTWQYYALRYPSQIRALIPEKIETTEVVSNDFSQQIGGGGDCGGISFRLSQKTINEIQTQGIAYFADIQFPKPEVHYREKSDTWRPWRETPPSDEDHENLYIRHGCVDNFEDFLEENNLRINKDTKGYYTYVTHRGFSNLWVFPDWGIIAYNYYY